MKIQRDLVIFLGAGFSCDAYLPIMRNFWNRSEESLKSLQKKHSTQDRGSANFRESASLLIEAGKAFQSFRECCRELGALSVEDLNDLEKIFCIAEALKEANVTKIQLNGQDCEIDVLIKQIQLWIWKTYQEFPFWNPERKANTNQNAYDKFFKVLLKYGARKTAVLTTNYDLVFECFAWQHKIPCVYGGGVFQSISAGHGSLPYAYLDESQHSDKPVLCKLHGSINYFPDASKGDNQIRVTNDLGDDRPILYSGSWKDKPAIFALDAISNIHNKYGNDLVPEIIPPTYAKLTQQFWLREIWHRAWQALVEAEKIIFVGYSFPDSDGFMSALLRGVIMQRARKPLKVYVVNPCPDAQRRYKDIFSDAYQPLNLMKFDNVSWEDLIK